MRVRRLTSAIAASVLVTISSAMAAPTMIPEDFPHFAVPGQEQAMTSLRGLFFHHYDAMRGGGFGTLWDEWLSPPTLWPAVDTDRGSEHFRSLWRNMLSGRVMEPDGYVSSHQHASIAHQHGWPFPYWHGGKGTAGWHFSFKNTADGHWRPSTTCTQEGWTPTGVRDLGIGEDGWMLELVSAAASVTAPKRTIRSFESPFLQLRWTANGLGNAQPYVEWTTPSQPDFSSERRMYFDQVETKSAIHYEMIPMYRHPQWKDEIAQLRIGFGNPAPGAHVAIQAFFTQYDTRHNINNQATIRGCTSYFWWTGDKAFLRQNINRLRLALRYLMTEHHGERDKLIRTTWVGHEGRSGLRLKDGKKEILFGEAVGSNYWDLMPFGNKDCYATMRYYDALLCMAELEREIATHPSWNIPGGPLALEADALVRHAAEVKETGNRVFWNSSTGRFVPAVDVNGDTHDYGLTFLNLEAIYYGFATEEHAGEIMKWIDGERIVADDTSTGTDIYHWRFAPRSTTKRNVDYYFWGWSAPESIPYGSQVQDGGAVLGFSYHDLMARLKTRGPDNARKRLQGILDWYGEVQAAGGYRKYYDGTRDGTLQGGGPPGGLGLDSEFAESIMPPTVMVSGFLGLVPHGDGFAINPQLPKEWPELTVDRIKIHDGVFSIRVTSDVVELSRTGPASEPELVTLPDGNWSARAADESAPKGAVTQVERYGRPAAKVDWARVSKLILTRQ